ncbi:MAG: chorismate mutase [Candidatus Woesearchaeota archaeon]
MPLENVRDEIDTLDQIIIERLAVRTKSSLLVPKWSPKDIKYLDIFKDLFDDYNNLVKALQESYNSSSSNQVSISEEEGDSKSLDIEVLDLLEKRILYGEQVISEKYKSSDGKKLQLIFPEREKQVLSLVKQKAESYELDGDIMASFYKTTIIPLTIKIEERYLKILEQQQS